MYRLHEGGMVIVAVRCSRTKTWEGKKTGRWPLEVGDDLERGVLPMSSFLNVHISKAPLSFLTVKASLAGHQDSSLSCASLWPDFQ
jgi:hypothetical protein